MTIQLQIWEGEFGTAYTDRNAVNWQVRVPAFREMIADLPVHRVLEVGCNRGHNLVALAEIIGGGEIIGIEPNEHALELARRSTTKAAFLKGHIFDLPFKDSYFDVVFTAGVLIHIPASDLPAAMHELYRVSRRYLLAIEYFAEQETPISYRDHDCLLWKRDFLSAYQVLFPTLKVVRSGYWTTEHGFDRSHWWLLEKAC